MSVANHSAKKNTLPSATQPSENRTLVKIVLGSAVGRIIAGAVDKIWDALIH